MRDAGSYIEGLWAWPLDAEMNEPFTIATGAKTEVNNVLVRLRLKDGTEGYGEGAPLSAFNGETQAKSLAAIKSQARFLIGRPIAGFRPLLESLEERLGPRLGAAKAALGMAVLDAWCRRARIPLRILFGGAQTRVFTDVTVTIGTPQEALAAARRIVRLGVRTIKIKVGKDIEQDVERVRLIASASPRRRLFLDGNQGYTPRQSLRLLRRLKRHGITPILFEQPAAKDDWEGLSDVYRLGKVPVAADESVTSRADAWRMARERCAQVVNIKLMKSGLLEAWDIAHICRAAGLGLMVGGMVESTLAMTCAAHFAAGLGGFPFVDLDTPLWFKRDPMRGMTIGRGGLYDLSAVKAGIGVVPLDKKYSLCYNLPTDR